MDKDDIEAVAFALTTARQANVDFRKNDGFDLLNR